MKPSFHPLALNVEVAHSYKTSEEISNRLHSVASRGQQSSKLPSRKLQISRFRS